jgi:hypothetical protein
MGMSSEVGTSSRITCRARGKGYAASSSTAENVVSRWKRIWGWLGWGDDQVFSLWKFGMREGGRMVFSKDARSSPDYAPGLARSSAVYVQSTPDRQEYLRVKHPLTDASTSHSVAVVTRMFTPQ